MERFQVRGRGQTVEKSFAVAYNVSSEGSAHNFQHWPKLMVEPIDLPSGNEEDGASPLGRRLFFCDFCAFSRLSQRGSEAEDRAEEFKYKAVGQQTNGREKAHKAQRGEAAAKRSRSSKIGSSLYLSLFLQNDGRGYEPTGKDGGLTPQPRLADFIEPRGLDETARHADCLSGPRHHPNHHLPPTPALSIASPSVISFTTSAGRSSPLPNGIIETDQALLPW